MTEPTDSVSTEDIERLVLVSNRLPFKKSWRGGRVKWTRSAGGLVTALDPVLRKTGGVWLGWGGDRPKQVPDREVKFFDVGAIKSPGFGGRYVIGEIPLTDAEVRNYYTGFANSTIWPLFHYFFEKCIIDADQWESYKEVNQIFAEAIANFARPDDLIWVQDYHLLLVPEYVHRLRADLKTHLFIHIPFPNYDILSILPWHVEILAGMTYASSVGFHDDRYLANFLASVERAGVAAVDEAQSCVRFKDGRKCTLYASGISIDFDHFDAVSRSSEARKARRRLRKQYGDMKLVLGVDRLDYSKGIKERLVAIEHCLEEHPELAETFAFYQIAVPSRPTVQEYQTIRNDIESLVGRINGRFSTPTWTPIHYFYRTVPFTQLVGTYRAADVGLVTPLRDGMNLVAKEYVASHGDEDGVLILSRFAGAARELKVGALLVNPYSIEQISDALYRALTMNPRERRRRMLRMRRVVKKNDINNWLMKCWSNQAGNHAENSSIHKGKPFENPVGSGL
ncbi:MAG: trehalose-6-phosphate synthase [Planctomycetota bacterium]|nr:MAG: trehalose-6-phosphate synthase [Planctomycetota bacterium]